MKRFIYILFFCAIVALFSSCRARQQVIRSDMYVADKTPGELVTDIIDNHFDFETFTARLSVNLSSGSRSVSTRANLRMIHDNAIQVSVLMPILSFEVFRMYVTPDWVVMLDILGRRYVQESITSLQQVFSVGIDYYTIQALFTNALFVPNKNYVEPSDYRQFDISLTPDRQFFLQTRDRRTDVEYSFIVSGLDRITQSSVTQGANSLVWTYSNFSLVNETPFPHRMNVELGTQSRQLSSNVTFSNIAINQSISINPTIPNGFSRTSLAAAIQIFNSML